MEQSGSGDYQTDTGLSSQIANRLGSVAGGLLVPHSDVLQPGDLEGHGQFDDRDADDAKDILHALFSDLEIMYGYLESPPSRQSNVQSLNSGYF